MTPDQAKQAKRYARQVISQIILLGLGNRLPSLEVLQEDWTIYFSQFLEPGRMKQMLHRALKAHQSVAKGQVERGL